MDVFEVLGSPLAMAALVHSDAWELLRLREVAGAPHALPSSAAAEAKRRFAQVLSYTSLRVMESFLRLGCQTLTLELSARDGGERCEAALAKFKADGLLDGLQRIDASVHGTALSVATCLRWDVLLQRRASGKEGDAPAAGPLVEPGVARLPRRMRGAWKVDNHPGIEYGEEHEYDAFGRFVYRLPAEAGVRAQGYVASFLPDDCNSGAESEWWLMVLVGCRHGELLEPPTSFIGDEAERGPSQFRRLLRFHGEKLIQVVHHNDFLDFEDWSWKRALELVDACSGPDIDDAMGALTSASVGGTNDELRLRWEAGPLGSCFGEHIGVGAVAP
eukprot:CAMPEP_0117549382 /NCGR_PEP_ID=MMETSP0784-20121206/48136_1 /TAXON_ID=39447 /ORGANISM="" /LENGTH=330 /DNA_ID=CAMNT_0005346367 /DNA_START=77 /DNA_END=1068 /DNA_ORIENTATION=+